MNPAAILAAAATAATITLGAGSYVGAAEVAPATCLLAVHPWDGLSRRLEVETTAGTQVLLSVQDNRTPLGGERIFELNASTIRRVNWTWNRQAGAWRVSLAVGLGCEMEPYPFWQHGEHEPSLSMAVGAVPTTTTTAPTTTTTAEIATTTTVLAPVTTEPQPQTAQRVTPAPTTSTTEVAARAPQLPATGRHTWPQVRLTLALVAAGVACLQLARVMQQDDETAGDEE